MVSLQLFMHRVKEWLKKEQWIKSVQPIQVVGILTLLILLFIVIPFIAFNDLTRWDAPGHVFSAQFTSEQLFPHFSGWNLLSFSGFGQNYFYPPLFYWLSALLNQVLPLDVAIKLLLTLSFLLIPYSAYFLGKKFHLTDQKTAWFTFFLTAAFMVPNTWFNVGALGGNLASTINVGLYPNGFVFPLLLFAIGIMRESFETNQWKLSGTLIAICLLTHYVGGLLLVFLAIMTIYFRKKETIFTSIKITVTALLLSSFWWIKGLLFQSEWFSVPIIRLDNIGIIVFLVMTIVVISYRAKKKEQDEVDWVIWIILGGLTFLYLFFAPLHYYRFLAPLGIWVVLAIVKTFSEKTLSKLAILAGIIMVIGFLNIDFSGENHLVGVTKLPQDRILYTASSVPYEYFHYSRYFLQQQGIEVAKGLFVESSRMSRYYSVVESEINPDAFIWGDYPYKLIIDPSLISWPIIEQQLDQLGISTIITDQENIPIGEKKFFATHRVTKKQNLIETLTQKRNDQEIKYYQYDLEKSELATIVRQPVFYPDQQTFNAQATKIFFALEAPTLIQTVPFELAKPTQAANVTLSKKSNEELLVTIDSDQPVLVQVKYVYFPNWHAYNDGKEIPIYVSTPRFMTVYAKGEVTFKFEPSGIENGMILVSAIALIILIALAVLKKNKGK